MRSESPKELCWNPILDPDPESTRIEHRTEELMHGFRMNFRKGSARLGIDQSRNNFDGERMAALRTILVV